MTIDQWLVLAGLFAFACGYAVALTFGPIARSFRDGLRCMRRRRELYWLPGLLGASYTLLDLAREVQRRFRLGDNLEPVVPVGVFEWQVPDWHAIATSEWATALQHVAGTFHVAVTAGPLGAIAAVALLLNWRRSSSITGRSLRRRFPRIGWLLHVTLLLTAGAAIVRTGMFFAIDFFAAREDARQILFYAGFVDAAGWAFEHLFGAFAQVALILAALAWVRGLSLEGSGTTEFALRRFSYVLPWVGSIVLMSVLVTHGPILATGYHPASLAAVLPWMPLIGAAMHLAVLVFPVMQIRMSVENRSLAEAMRHNFHFLRTHTGIFLLFLILSFVPFYGLAIVDRAITVSSGDWTIPYIAWRLLSPWIWAAPIGWILASWVCMDRACAVDRLDRGVAY